MKLIRTPRRGMSIALAATATLALVLPVAAADSVTQAVTGGPHRQRRGPYPWLRGLLARGPDEHRLDDPDG